MTAPSKDSPFPFSILVLQVVLSSDCNGDEGCSKCRRDRRKTVMMKNEADVVEPGELMLSILHVERISKN